AAGVPLKKPVAGIAMGLMVKDEDKGVNGDYVILTDIQGLEDHIGDMDFKVAGTYDGITAIQMDIKVKGLTIDLLRQALKQAKDARVFILDRIKEVIAEPRKTVSTFAPKVEVIQIKPDQIGLVIGGGGATIKKIIEQTETEIDINDEGRVVITGEKLEKIQQAKDWILGMTREITVGETFEHGKVMRIVDFGAFVEVLPGREGLVHVSKMAVGFVKNPSEIVKLGDEVKVRVEEIDEMGRVNLSMLFGDDLVKAQQQRQERSNNRFGNNNRGGRDNDEHRNSDFKRDGFRVKRDFRR
ncbi:S1 RNA-binding domain-containing protein, partial [Candidatus Beckwithbacteria bacterium]|nr:S1 RNA-binding domain-containing protein [Candidatus Beckwithbacteria bacterium]